MVKLDVYCNTQDNALFNLLLLIWITNMSGADKGVLPPVCVCIRLVE